MNFRQIFLLHSLSAFAANNQQNDGELEQLTPISHSLYQSMGKNDVISLDGLEIRKPAAVVPPPLKEPGTPRLVELFL